MGELSLRFATIGLVALGLLGCTLHYPAPLITLRLAPSISEARLQSAPPLSSGRRAAPPLGSITCFAVFATGTSQSITESQVAGRSPSCLGMTGEFLGYFSYSRLTGLPNSSGVTEGPAQIALPPGTYGFSVVALHNAALCSGPLSSLYDLSTPTETYTVTGTTLIDTRARSTGSLAVTYVEGATTNRTPNCLPSTFSCSGSAVCDSFTGPDATPITNHTADSGHSWSTSIVGGGSAELSSGALRLVDIGGSLATATSSYFMYSGRSVQASLQLGIGDVTSAGLVFRFINDQNFVFGGVFRNDILAKCEIRIVDVVAGAASTLVDNALVYPTECPRVGFNVLSFSETGGILSVRFAGYEVSVSYSGGNNGSSGGVAASMGPLTTDSPQFDWFKIL